MSHTSARVIPAFSCNYTSSYILHVIFAGWEAHLQLCSVTSLILVVWERTAATHPAAPVPPLWLSVFPVKICNSKSCSFKCCSFSFKDLLRPLLEIILMLCFEHNSVHWWAAVWPGQRLQDLRCLPVVQNAAEQPDFLQTAWSIWAQHPPLVA